VFPKVWVAAGDDRIGKGLGQVLWVVVAERNVTARQSFARSRGEGVDDVFARAVGDARGLEQESVWRVEQGRQDLHGGQVAREVDVAECRDDDERGNEQGENHPRAEQGVARAGFVLVLFGDTPLASLAQDGNGGGHGSYLTTKGQSARRDLVRRKDERKWKVGSG